MFAEISSNLLIYDSEKYGISQVPALPGRARPAAEAAPSGRGAPAAKELQRENVHLNAACPFMFLLRYD